MSTPLVPNFTPGSGRLVTDRFDFQKHIEGQEFRHQADQTDLNPHISIDGYVKTTTQSALEALSIIAFPPVIPDANLTSKGIIKLSEDLAGTADLPKVVGLQGIPITTTIPTAGELLIFDGYHWTPGNSSGSFIPGGDLSGNSVSQNVISITGSANTVDLLCSNVLFTNNIVAPTFKQITPSISSDGQSMNIFAQSGNGGLHKGGRLKLGGGNGASGNGGVSLYTNQGTTSVLQVVEPVVGQHVLSFAPYDLTTSYMPSGTGDYVFYIADTASPPTSGTPINGSLLYSSGGTLRIKQSDSTDFQIGSIPNPSIWGPTGAQTISTQVQGASAIGSSVNTYIYNIPNSTSVKADAIVVGKIPGTGESGQYNLSFGSVRNGSSTAADLGTLTTTDARVSGSFTLASGPTISRSGSHLVFTTGYSSSVIINWFFIIQLTILGTA